MCKKGRERREGRKEEGGREEDWKGGEERLMIYFALVQLCLEVSITLFAALSEDSGIIERHVRQIIWFQDGD
jgi:hypothetical protein